MQRFCFGAVLATSLWSCGNHVWTDPRPADTELDDAELSAGSRLTVGITWNGKAAREELRKVNPTTMKHRLIKVIPDIQLTSGSFADRVHGLVYLYGANSDNQWSLYGIDARTGVVRSVAPWPKFSCQSDGGCTGFNFGAGLHVMADGKTVGITWNGEEQREEIRSVDPATMTHSFIAVIPGIGWTSDYFTDVSRGIVYVRGSPDGKEWILYGINAATGALLSSAPMPKFESLPDGGWSGFNFGAGIHFMNDGSIVGVTWHGEMNREELRRVNPATMEHSLIAPIPEVKWTADWSSDPKRNVVYFRGRTDSPVWKLYAVDAKSGAVLSSPEMPPFSYNADAGTYEGYNFGGGFHFMR